MTDIVKELSKKYGLTKEDIWPVPGGRAHAIRHAALERIAAECGITFDHPQIIEADSANKIVTLLVTARMGDRVEWTFGEAHPANCKNAYTWAMAEKRGKDRCILKLLNAHGDIYSEDEFDGARRRDDDNPPAPLPASIDDDGAMPDRRLRKGRPPRFDDMKDLVRGTKDFAEMQLALGKPYFKNTISDWTNYWIRQLIDNHVVPKIAEFRGAEVALEMQNNWHKRYPVEEVREAAE